MDIHEYMQQAKSKRFAWGTFDCFNFAAGAIKIVTGKDLMAKISPYGDETSAEIMVRECYGTNKLRDVFEAEAKKAGAQEIKFEEAKDGDIACVQFPYKFQHANKLDQSCGMGVIYQGSVYVCTQSGVQRVPNAMPIIDVWRF